MLLILRIESWAFGCKSLYLLSLYPLSLISVIRHSHPQTVDSQPETVDSQNRFGFGRMQWIGCLPLIKRSDHAPFYACVVSIGFA